TVALRPAMYNGIRHFVFVSPPLAVLGGLAAAWLIEAAQQRPLLRAAIVGVIVTGIAAPVVAMAKLHPYEYTSFNWASGGVRHARGRYMLDYWGLSFKQASQTLLAKLAEQHA